MESTAPNRKRRIARKSTGQPLRSPLDETRYHYRVTYRGADWDPKIGPTTKIFASTEKFERALHKLRSGTPNRPPADILSVARIQISGKWEEADL